MNKHNITTIVFLLILFSFITGCEDEFHGKKQADEFEYTNLPTLDFQKMKEDSENELKKSEAGNK